jgi:hypothetical protein
MAQCRMVRCGAQATIRYAELTVQCIRTLQKILVETIRVATDSNGLQLAGAGLLPAMGSQFLSPRNAH